MNERLRERLREADPAAGLAPYDALAQNQVMARARIEAETLVPAPTRGLTSGRSWSRPLAMAGAVAGTVAVMTVVAVGVPGGPSQQGATQAPAASSPNATDTSDSSSRKALTRSQVLAAGKACAKVVRRFDDGPSLRASDVLIAEHRPLHTYALMRQGGWVLDCTISPEGESSVNWYAGGVPSKTPTPDRRSVIALGGPQGWAAKTPLPTDATAPLGKVDFSGVTGRAGAEVTKIDIVLENGATLPAALTDGWWTAWWPETKGPETARPWQVTVHTRDGRSSTVPGRSIVVSNQAG